MRPCDTKFWLPLAAVVAVLLALASCSDLPENASTRVALHPNETPELRALITSAAARHSVPVDLVQRVVLRESRHIPTARSGPYLGLMQILPETAHTMGYRGPADGLFDPATNLEYGVKYLRGAWIVADGDRDAAVGWYARGYYYEAKRRGLLEESGLR